MLLRRDDPAAPLGFYGKLAKSRFMLLRTLSLVAALSMFAPKAVAQDGQTLTLIVSRGDDSATYYISMPANGIEPILATDPDILFSEDGRVPIDNFRVAGSFDLADDIFANVTGSLEGKSFEFEAMSMMVHPKVTPLPFGAPWDAYTAISVCSVSYTPDQLVPGALQLYYGGFTDQVSGDAPLNIHFPATGRAAMDIVVHQYQNGRLVGTEVQTLSDGGTLVVEATSGSLTTAWIKKTGPWLALLGLAAFGVFLLRTRDSKSATVPSRS
jgi:hypothetical protein